MRAHHHTIYNAPHNTSVDCYGSAGAETFRKKIYSRNIFATVNNPADYGENENSKDEKNLWTATKKTRTDNAMKDVSHRSLSRAELEARTSIE